MRVVIVRDRESAGGGIHHYYHQVAPKLACSPRMVDVGRAHGFYSGGSEAWIGRLPTPLRLTYDWFLFVLELLRFPDLVHLNPGLDIKTCKSLRRDAVNLLLAKLFGRKVLVFWRGWHNDACGSAEFPGGNWGWMSRVYRKADAHVVLASVFRDDLQRWGFTSPISLETTVVGDAVLGGSPPSRSPVVGRRFRVLYLSRVEVAKGVFEMLEAFALLESRHPGSFEFVVAGDGPGLQDMKERAAGLGLTGVDFTGYVEGGEKLECFRKADAFCFLSYTEGMPNAVLEAMAMGLPLVSSEAGGLKDILEDGVTGYLVLQDRSKPVKERFSAEEVAERIERLAGAGEERERIGRHNAAYARERFAAEKVAARLESIYRDVVGA